MLAILTIIREPQMAGTRFADSEHAFFLRFLRQITNQQRTERRSDSPLIFALLGFERGSEARPAAPRKSNFLWCDKMKVSQLFRGWTAGQVL